MNTSTGGETRREFRSCKLNITTNLDYLYSSRKSDLAGAGISETVFPIRNDDSPQKSQKDKKHRRKRSFCVFCNFMNFVVNLLKSAL
jgi:hypothetical protein